MDRTGTIEVNGTALYYEERGEGHPLVLVHAGIADSRMWDDQMEPFASRYTVIRYDLRGYGRSAMPPQPYSHHEDLYALLRALGVARAHLVGVSIGGATIVDFTLAHPEMVSALVPVGPGVGGLEIWPNEHEMALFQEGEDALNAGDLARANEIEVHVWVDGPDRSPAQVDPEVRRRVAEMNAAVLARQGEHERARRRPLEPPAAGRLGEIRAPTFVIVGDQDCSDIQQLVDALVAGVPGARKLVIRDAAHVPNIERPAVFNRAVLDFLATA